MDVAHARTDSTAGYATSIGRLIALRAILNEMAWTHKLAELPHLIRREDIPRTPQSLPRPLTAEQDHLLQQELMRRNDLAGNVFLLLRHTGMRIGECVDLCYDCRHSVSPNQWAIHVPLGKRKRNAWFRLMPSFVISFIDCASSALWIRWLTTDGSWPGMDRESLFLRVSAITCIWPVTLPAYPPVSSPISCAIRTERRCSVPAWALPRS